MSITAFRQELQALGLGARKRNGEDCYEITVNGEVLCVAASTHIQAVASVRQLLAEKQSEIDAAIALEQVSVSAQRLLHKFNVIE